MSEDLNRIKGDVRALEAAYVAAGGVLCNDRKHNSCPLCGDKTGFSIFVDDKGLARFKCYSIGGEKGTIVDLVMLTEKVDSKEAIKRVLEKYGPGHKDRQTGMSAPPVKQEKKTKLHLNPDLAAEALLWSLQQGRLKGKGVADKDVKTTFYKYSTFESPEPVVEVVRFDWLIGDQRDKDVRVIHRDGNGWRATKGAWGKDKKFPMYRAFELRRALTRENEKREEAKN